MRSTRRTFIAVATSAALLALPSAAFAAERPGAADRDAGPAATEDDDTNDGGTPNNVVDDGDNAHPSGKDRSVEHGQSGNQGNAQSDPDDDGRGPDRSNGGADQPDGDGGVDKADQDGNNGCGNDDDFEDDNEGWCLGRDGDRPSGTATRGETAARRDAESSAKRSSERTPERDRGSETEHDAAQGDTAATAPTTSTTTTAGAVGSEQERQRPTPGNPAPSGEMDLAVPAGPAPVETGVLGVVLERPAAPTSALPAAAGEVLAAGLDVQAVGAPTVGAPATGSSGTLPRSGTDAVPAAVAAALALLAGTVAVRRTRVG